MFLLNNDAVAELDAISELMTFVADKPAVGMLACRVSRLDKPNFFDSVGLLLYPDGVCRSRGWQAVHWARHRSPMSVRQPWLGASTTWWLPLVIRLSAATWRAHLERRVMAVSEPRRRGRVRRALGVGALPPRRSG